MSLKDLDDVIHWIKRSSFNINVHLFGGEPLLHPNILKIIIKMKRNNVDISTIFTNGLGDTELYRRIMEVNGTKFWLVNVNNPNTYTTAQWKLLNRNLELLRWKDEDLAVSIEDVQRLQLGINFYYPNQEYAYFINLAKKNDCPYVRFSVSMPSSHKSNIYADFDGLVKLKPTLLKFIKDCVREEIATGWDCIIPPCIFTLKEIVYLVHFTSHFSSTCQPHFDILENKVAYCVPMRGILPLYDIRDFTAEEIFRRHTIEARKYKEYILPRCKDCHYSKSGLCQGFCLRYKADLLRDGGKNEQKKMSVLESLSNRFKCLS